MRLGCSFLAGSYEIARRILCVRKADATSRNRGLMGIYHNLWHEFVRSALMVIVYALLFRRVFKLEKFAQGKKKQGYKKDTEGHDQSVYRYRLCQLCVERNNLDPHHGRSWRDVRTGAIRTCRRRVRSSHQVHEQRSLWKSMPSLCFLLRSQYHDYNERLQGMHHGPASLLPSVGVHRSRATHVLLRGKQTTENFPVGTLRHFWATLQCKCVRIRAMQLMYRFGSDHFLLIDSWARRWWYRNSQNKWANFTITQNSFLNRHANV